MSEPTRFQLDRSSVPTRRRGGVIATTWIAVLLLVAGVAFIGSLSDGPPPAARTIAAVVPSAGVAAPSWFHVEMTPRIGIVLPPSTHSAPLPLQRGRKLVK